MKKSYNFLILAAFVAAAISCSKENISDNPSQKAEGEGTTLSLTVGTETKTLLRPSSKDPGEVHWSMDDKIKVFNNSSEGSLFSTENSDTLVATFTCDKWIGGTPVWAVHSSKASSSTCTYTKTDTTIRTYLNPTQIIKHKQSYALAAAASIGRVSGTSKQYYINQMKNLFSLIKFKVKNDSIVKITMTGKNNEVLAGWIDVDYNNGDPDYEFVKDEGKDTLVVTVTGSACKVKNSGLFSNETTYYISVLPQTLSEGFKLELQKENGAKATREIASVTLNRNEIRALKHPLDSALAFEPITMTLNKDEWPFEPSCVETKDQQKTGTDGETYTYKYTDDGEKSCTFEIANGNGETTGYSYTSGSWLLRFGDTGNGSWIKLPAIEGRKLFSVTVTISNTSKKTFQIKTAPDATTTLYSKSLTATKGSTVSATYINDSLSYNTSYYIYLSSGRYFQLTELTLVYDK